MIDKYIIKVFRGVPGKQYWESFELKLFPSDNVISALIEIQKNPINMLGEIVNPIAWEQGCLEEVCGSCAILVNRRPRQACSTIIRNHLINGIIHIAPLTKFPLIRDLIVDRSIMFDNLRKIQGWIQEDSEKKGFGPKISQKDQALMYSLSMCMTCGCCSEACPQINEKSDFIGPAAISQVRFFNMYPKDIQKEDRVKKLMEKGGVGDCGHAQNCVKVCPKKLPLTESIAVLGKQATKQGLKNLLSFFLRKRGKTK